jgi:hypothetical protein
MKRCLNRMILAKFSDQLFKRIDRFFRGPSCQVKSNLISESVYQFSNPVCNTFEWELNQDASDIFFSDIYFIINNILPKKVIKALYKFRLLIGLYIILDDLNEENDKIQAIYNESKNYQPRIIFFANKRNRDIRHRILSFIDWLKKMLQNIAIFVHQNQPERIYSLIGDFSVDQCGKSFDSNFTMNRTPGKDEFLSSTPFHKRN